jgi:hypothetical protein
MPRKSSDDGSGVQTSFQSPTEDRLSLGPDADARADFLMSLRKKYQENIMVAFSTRRIEPVVAKIHLRTTHAIRPS